MQQVSGSLLQEAGGWGQRWCGHGCGGGWLPHPGWPKQPAARFVLSPLPPGRGEQGPQGYSGTSGSRRVPPAVEGAAPGWVFCFAQAPHTPLTGVFLLCPAVPLACLAFLEAGHLLSTQTEL